MSSLRERASAILVRLLASLPDAILRPLAGRPVGIDDQQLNPQMQIALRLEGLLGTELLPVAEARERRRRDARLFAGPRIEVQGVSDLSVPGPAGPIAARLYVPAGFGATAPLVVYYHGGGHVIGDLDTHDQPCRFLARTIPARVLAIDYRLAPEHPFPAAVEDALAAFNWAHAQAAAIGADPDRIAVAGDSAGGNLAAAVSRLAVAGDGPAPCFQALVYPVVDYSEQRRSYDLFGEGFFLTREEMDWFGEHYFARPEDRTDPRASPILAPDLAGLPPAFVLSAGFDPLRDEAEEYVSRLRDAGVATTLRREPDLVHGFINAVGLGGRAREASEGIAAALRAGLRGPAVARDRTPAATLTDPPG